MASLSSVFLLENPQCTRGSSARGVAPAESACLPPQRIQRALRGACRDTLQINSKVVTGTENVSDALPASTRCTATANQEIGKRGKEWGLVQVCVGLVSKLQSNLRPDRNGLIWLNIEKIDVLSDPNYLHDLKEILIWITGEMESSFFDVKKKMHFCCCSNWLSLASLWNPYRNQGIEIGTVSRISEWHPALSILQYNVGVETEISPKCFAMLLNAW